MFAKYKRRFEYAIDRLDVDFHFVFHRASTGFCSKSALSDLNFELTAYANDSGTARFGIKFKQMVTLESLNEEQHFDYLGWINSCKNHPWPIVHCESHKVTENSVMLDLCRSILVPLSREVILERKFGLFFSRQPRMPSCDDYIKVDDIGMGVLDTWHGTPDLRVRGSEVLYSGDLYDDEISANNSDDESVAGSDGATSNWEGKVLARDKNLPQAVGTCVVSSFTEKSLHPGKNPLVPCILIDKEKFRVILYDCESDFLLITDPKPLSTKSNLSQSSMVFLWIIINHR
jgi:hypothetical protein